MAYTSWKLWILFIFYQKLTICVYWSNKKVNKKSVPSCKRSYCCLELSWRRPILAYKEKSRPRLLANHDVFLYQTKCILLLETSSIQPLYLFYGILRSCQWHKSACWCLRDPIWPPITQQMILIKSTHQYEPNGGLYKRLWPDSAKFLWNASHHSYCYRPSNRTTTLYLESHTYVELLYQLRFLLLCHPASHFCPRLSRRHMLLSHLGLPPSHHNVFLLLLKPPSIGIWTDLYPKPPFQMIERALPEGVSGGAIGLQNNMERIESINHTCQVCPLLTSLRFFWFWSTHCFH